MSAVRSRVRTRGEDAAMPRVLTEQQMPPVLEVVTWRFGRLEAVGYPVPAAVELAERLDVDLHQACELLERGASVEQALAILR